MGSRLGSQMGSPKWVIFRSSEAQGDNGPNIGSGNWYSPGETLYVAWYYRYWGIPSWMEDPKGRILGIQWY